MLLLPALLGCAAPDPQPPAPQPTADDPQQQAQQQQDVVELTLRADPAAEERAIEREAQDRRARGLILQPVAMDPHLALVCCRVLVLAERYGEAMDGYQDLVDAWPDALLPRMALARLAVAGGDFEGAAGALTPVLDRVDELPDGNYLSGVALLHGGDRDEGIRRLREELATGEFCSEAGLELAAHFASRELHGEAMSVVAAARQRRGDDLSLSVCEVRLWFDTCRWIECRARVEELLVSNPDDHRLWLLMADVAQSQGDREAALAALNRLLTRDSMSDPFVRERVEALQLRAGALRELQPDQRPPLGADALFAMLRGAEQLSQRLAAYQALSGDPRTAEVAAAIALRQEAPLLRVAALKRFRSTNPDELLGICLALTDDPDPRVRAVLALRAGRDLPQSEAIRFLLAQLEAEEDAYAFGCAHEALTRVMGAAVQMSTGSAADPAVRQRVREEWRQLCPE